MDNIVAIIDQSGSMTGYEKQTVDGFNEFIQQQLDISPDAVVTLVFFNHSQNIKYTNIALPDVQKLEHEDYRPFGSTALNDALGNSINKAEAYEDRHNIDKTIFAIFTDGYENSSQEYTPAIISDKVKTLEKHNGWEFIYVGCDHDVHAAASNLGMKSANTVAFNKVDLATMYDKDNVRSFAASVGSYRTNKK